VLGSLITLETIERGGREGRKEGRKGGRKGGRRRHMTTSYKY